MARTPNNATPPADLPEINETEVRTDLVAADTMAAAARIAMQSTELMKQVGRIEMGQFLATVADRAIAETYVKIRDSKTYNGMVYIGPDGDVRQVATLDEFCDVFMPRSYRRCQELASNLQLLGPALYEQAEAIGIRQKDYNALKALPADDQVLIKHAIEETKSRDEVLDLLQEMAVKHSTEKTALTKAAADARADYEAQQTISKNKQKRIDELERETARIAHLEPDQRLDELRQKAVTTAGMAEVAVRALGQELEALRAFRADHPGTDEPILAGLLANIERALIGLKNEYGIEDAPIADERPEWVRLKEAGKL